MDISVSSSSSSSTEDYLKKLLRGNIYEKLSKYGDEGVRILSSATPKESGQTAASWSYEIVHEKNSYTIYWLNSHMAGRAPVAVLLQYGHRTGTGGYVQGRDYINPVMKPLFDKIADEAWKELTAK